MKYTDKKNLDISLQKHVVEHLEYIRKIHTLGSIEEVVIGLIESIGADADCFNHQKFIATVYDSVSDVEKSVNETKKAIEDRIAEMEEKPSEEEIEAIMKSLDETIISKKEMESYKDAYS